MTTDFVSFATLWDSQVTDSFNNFVTELIRNFTWVLECMTKLKYFAVNIFIFLKENYMSSLACAVV